MSDGQTDISLNDWQIAKIENALAEADRGEFATDEEVNLALTKWLRVAAQKSKN